MKIQEKNSIETCTKYKEERVNIKPKRGKLVIKYHSNTPKSFFFFFGKLQITPLMFEVA